MPGEGFKDWNPEGAGRIYQDNYRGAEENTTLATCVGDLNEEAIWL